jgi:aminobenzoyl-glutamate utilization protein B
LREHINPSARIHYVYKDAGNIPNVIPDKATVWIWMRDSRRSGVKNLEDRIRKIADGAALMAGVNVEIKLNTGCYELLINETGARLLQKNIDWLGGITYTKEEMDFAEKIMKEYGANPKGINGKVKPLQQTREEPEGGSTDVGDVSYLVPEITLYTTTAPFGAPDHSWVIVACSGMSIGEKGMLYSAKALGITMVDLFENEQLRKDIRSEFEKRRGTEKWKALLPE